MTTPMTSKITIWEYRLTLGENRLDVALRTTWPWLHVANQDGLVTVWVEIDASQPEEEWILWVVPTGGTVPPKSEYVGTALVSSFVWHVYVEGNWAHRLRVER